MDTKPVIIAQNIHKQFKGPNGVVRALDDISLTVLPRTMTALIGPDGAGKTTFMRLVCGLMPLNGGLLTVLDTNVMQNPQEVQNRISYMSQRFGLYEDLTIQENLNLYADLHNVSIDQRQKRFPRLLKMTGLTQFTQRPAGKLSGGMKQKLGLICTLVRSPELLVLDEPTMGVDPLSRRELWAILRQMVREENLTVLVSTAYMNEASLCEKVIMLHQGRILAQGSPNDIKQNADGLCYTLAPANSEPPRELQARLLYHREHIIDAVPQNGKVHFIIKNTSSLHDLSAVKQHAEPQKIAAELEDGFMVLLHQNSPAHPAENIISNPLASLTPKNNASSPEIVIEVRDLVRKFGNFTAVNNTSFNVAGGEIFGLLGPNGAGKTTTFRMLCGLLPATSGLLSVAGINLRKARAKARANIGYVAQKFSLYGNLTIQENLNFFGGIYGLYGKRLFERIEEVKQQFNLLGHENKPSGLLPVGFKQRLAMAVGLLHQPEILFLDEPTSGIDPLARRDFWRRITELAAHGTTIIITTHFMEEAEYCDRILIQDQGTMLALGTPTEVRAQAGDHTTNMNEAFIKIIEQAHAARNQVKEAA